MGGKLVRKTDVKERTRGPHTVLFKLAKLGITALGGLKEADEKGLVVASQLRLHRIIVESHPSALPLYLPAFTGTAHGFCEPDTSFERATEKITDYERIAGSRFFLTAIDLKTKARHVIPIPEDSLSTVNGIVVMEHPNHRRIIEGNDVLWLPAEGMSLNEAMAVLKNFPTKNGHYEIDPVHGMPFGSIVSEVDSNVVYLFRSAKGISLSTSWLAYHTFGCKHGIQMGVWPSSSLGMAVESDSGSALVETPSL